MRHSQSMTQYVNDPLWSSNSLTFKLLVFLRLLHRRIKNAREWCTKEKYDKNNINVYGHEHLIILFCFYWFACHVCSWNFADFISGISFIFRSCWFRKFRRRMWKNKNLTRGICSAAGSIDMLRNILGKMRGRVSLGSVGRGYWIVDVKFTIYIKFWIFFDLFKYATWISKIAADACKANETKNYEKQ